jgi:hypothetical protein
VPGAAARYDPTAMLLPVVWAIFVLLAVISFVMVAAYWLDVQDRPELTFRRRVALSVAVALFPLTIPVYANLGGGGWPRVMRVASFIPMIALALFASFLFGLIH